MRIASSTSAIVWALRRACELVGRDRHDALEAPLEPRETVPFDLPDPLAAQTELLADLLERRRLAGEAVPHLEHAPLSIRQLGQRALDRMPAVRIGRLLHRILGLRIREEVAELAVAVAADRMVQRHRRLDRAERLLDVLQLETRCRGELLLRRRRARGRLQPLPCTGELHAPLVHVRRDADRRGLVRDRTLACLANPPGRVRRELVSAPPVELLHRPVQADHALLDQVAELETMTLVALRDRDDEAEVGVDHQLLRREIAALDAL